MSAHNRHLSSILVSFSTFVDRAAVSSPTAEEAILTFVKFLEQKKSLKTWSSSELASFLEKTETTLKEPMQVRSLLTQFVTQFPPHQVSVFLHEFLLALHTDNCSPATLKNYRSDINQFIAWAGSTELTELLSKPKVEDFLRYEQQKGLKDASVKRKLVSITQFALWAEAHQLVHNTSRWLTELNQGVDRFLHKRTVPAPGKKTEHPVSKKTQPSRWSLPLPHSLQPPFSNANKLGHSAQARQDYRSRLQASLRGLSKRVSEETRHHFLPYLNLVMIALFFIGAAYLGYQQFGSNAADPLAAYPTSLNRPNRTLSFQGRLTDTNQLPITSPTAMTFRLYDVGPGTGGSLLWTGSCSVTPDQDGIFSTGLGSDCGSEITENVFTENSNVWLEVEVASEVLTPRQQIKTVAYALNSETLQGYPASASAVENTVLVMNTDGEVVFGNLNPVLKATGQSFAIEANTLTLRTAAGSNGDVVLDPDGAGITQVLSDFAVDGYISAPGATLSATYADGTALTLQAGPGATAPILSWETSAGSQLGVIDAGGRVGIGTTAPTEQLEVAGNARIANTSTANLTIRGESTGSPLNRAALILSSADQNRARGIFSQADGTTNQLFFGQPYGSEGYFSIGYGATNPQALSNSLFTLQGSTGNVGIGTTAPGSRLSVAGDITLTGALRVSGDAGTTGYLLTSAGGAANTWTDPDIFCYSDGSNCAIVSRWDVTSGALHPTNSTLDLLIGGTATSSARFAFINVNSGAPTASMSGNLALTAPTGANPGTSLNVLNGGTFSVRTSTGGDAALTSRLFVNNQGFIGIGTTAPGSRLSVAGNAAIGSTYATTAAPADGLIVQGDVGIGTSAPNMQLHVDGNMRLNDTPLGDEEFHIGPDSGSSDTAISMYNSGYTYELHVDNTGLFQILNEDETTDYLTITQAGNVGLGTDTPTSGLDVRTGNITTTGGASVMSYGAGTPGATNTEFIRLTHTGSLGELEVGRTGTGSYHDFRIITNNTELMRLRANGNVGIGTSAPNALFHLSDNFGIMRFGDNNSAVGTSMAGLDFYSDFEDIRLGRMGFFGDGHLLIQNDHASRDIFIMPSASRNVGVGTTSPIAKLDVEGQIRVGTLTGTATNQLCFDANNILTPCEGSSALTGAGVQNYVARWTSATNLSTGVLYDNAINVGVGTSNPGSPLDVVGNIRTSARVLTADGTATQPAYRFTNDTGVGMYRPAANSLSLVTSGTDRIYINSGGNVGVGTTNPGYRLDVEGTLKAGVSQLGYRTGGTSGVEPVLYVHNTTASNLAQGNGALIQFVNSTNNNTNVLGSAIYSESVNNHYGWSSKLTFQVRSNNAFTTQNVIDAMTILPSGNVGIGTAAPATVLNVGGSSNKSISVDSTANRAFYGAYQDAAVIGVNRDPAVGTFYSTGKAASYISLIGAANSGYIDFLATNTNNTNPPSRMRITGDGNVGIGTTAPTYLLDISGTLRATGNVRFSGLATGTDNSVLVQTAAGDIVTDEIDSRVWGTSLVDGAGTTNRVAYWTDANTVAADDDFFFNGTNVGIGTTSPSQQLQVAGTGQFGTLRTDKSSLLTVYGHPIPADGSTSDAKYLLIAKTADNFHLSISGRIQGNRTDRPDGGAIIDFSFGRYNASPGALTYTVIAGGHTSANLYRPTPVTVTYGGEQYYALKLTGGWNSAWHSGATTADLKIYAGTSLNRETVLGAMRVVDLSVISGEAAWNSTSSEVALGSDLYVRNNAIFGNNASALSFTQNGNAVCDASGNCGQAGMPAGTTGQTLRYNGSNWVANSTIFNNGTDVGIGITSPAAVLDVSGSHTSGNSLLLRSGDASTGTDSTQIRFGYNNTANYMHSIRTRHSSGAAVNNAIDFWLWTNADAAGTVGSKHVMSLDGSGNVGIGTTAPGATLDIANAADATIILAADTGNSAEDANPRFELRQDGGLVAGALGYIGNVGDIYTNSHVNALYLMNDYASSLHLGTGATIQATLTDVGNLGIGTTAPSQRLDVSGAVRLGAAGANNVLNTSVAGGAPSGSLYWGNRVVCDSTGNCGQAGMPAGTSGQTLRYDGSNWVANSTLFNNGTNVGIGTTSPGEQLDVLGNLRVGGADAGPNYIAFRGTTGDQPGNYNHTYIGERLYGGTEQSELVLFKGNDIPPSSGPDRIRAIAGEIRFDTYTTATLGTFEQVATAATVTNRMTIANNGNVGIGTTNPTLGLVQLQPPSTVDTALALRPKSGLSGYTLSFTLNDTGANILANSASRDVVIGANSLTNQLVLKPGGNVGIGTTNPGAPLHVETAVSGAGIRVKNTSSTGFGDIRFEDSGGSFRSRIHHFNPSYASSGAWQANALAIANNTTGINLVADGSSGAIRFYTGASATANERMRIIANGNVGIGTTAPSAALDIGGSTLPALEVAGTQLMRYKYGPNTFNVSGAPIVLEYTDSGSSGVSTASFMIYFKARDDSNDYLDEVWYFGAQAQYLNAGYTYTMHRVSGTKKVRAYEVTNSGSNLEIEWHLTDDGAGFNDSVEITVMEVLAGHGEAHRGNFTAIPWASRSGGTEITNGGNGHATFGGSGSHWLMGNVGIGTTDPSTNLDVAGGFEIGTNRLLQYADDNNGITKQGSSGGWAFGLVGAKGSAGADLGGFGAFGSSDSLTRFYIGEYSSNELISIEAAGDVGIGVTDPTQKLDVNGQARIRTINNATGDVVTVASNGTLQKRTPAQIVGDAGAMTNWLLAASGTAGTQSITNGNTVTITGGAGLSATRSGGNITVAGITTGQGVSIQGNFGQWQSHGTYSDFNAVPAHWGWNYVQGNTNAPNTTSSQWYRNVVSLGNSYAPRGAGGYSLEMAIPRLNHTSAGMWVRTVENGAIGSWSQVGSRILGNFIADGNVGIATTNPGSNLEIGHYTKTSENTFSMLTEANYDSTIRLREESDAYGFDILYDGSATNDLYFVRHENSVPGEVMMTLDRSTGNVGIGNTAPAHALDVTGNAYASRFYVGSGDYFYHDSSRIKVFSQGTNNVAEFASYGMYLPLTGQTYNLYTGGSIKVGHGEEAEIDISNEVQISSSGVSYFNGGNIGIGTSTPGSLLDIAGYLGFTPTSYASFRKTGGEGILMNNGNDVEWLGSTSSSGYGHRLYSIDPGGLTHLRLARRNNSTTWTDMVTFTTTGRVGIGTTAPYYLLQANGDIYANGGWMRVSGDRGIYFQTYAGGWYMTDSSWIRNYNSKPLNIAGNGTTAAVFRTGRVGVGTESPLADLHVEGAIFSRAGLTSNLIQDPQFSQGTTYWNSGWTRETVTLGNGELVNSARIATSGNVQVVSDPIPVDPYKTYRFSIWIRSNNASDGTRYFGMHAYNGSSQVNTYTSGGTGSTNHYFWYGDVAANQWRKVTGYLMPCDAGTGWADPPDTTSLNYRMDCSTNQVVMRFLNFYNSGVTVTNWFALPSIEEVQASGVAYTQGYSDYIINVGGNVGIGTVSPGFPLDISGNTRVTGNLYVGTNGNYLSSRPSGAAGYGEYGSIQINGGGDNGWEGYSIDGRFVFMSDDDNTVGLYNDVANQWALLYERNSYLRLYEPDSGNVALNINTNGNVGIGNTNPSTAKLQVSGNIYPEGYYIVQNGINGGSTRGIRMWTGADSNWGIYMGQSGSTRSMAGGTAVAGAGFSSHAIRIRTTNSSSQGLIYENNAEQLNFSVRGSDGLGYFRGNLGIGDTNPTAKLEVAGNTVLSASSGTALTVNTTGSNRQVVLANTNAGAAADIQYDIGGVTRWALSSRGSGENYEFATWRHVSPNQWAKASFYNYATNNFVVVNNVGIGNINPGYRLQVNGDAAKNSGGSSWVIASDERLKRNVRDFTDGLSVLTKIRPVSYELNGQGGMPEGEESIGVIAQEILPYAPYTIGTFTADLNGQQTELYNYDDSAITYILVNSVQEQQLQIASSSARIAQLTSASESLSFTSEGSLQLAGTTGNYTVTPTGSTALTTVAGFAQTVSGTVRAGLTTTRELVVSQTAQLQNVSVQTLSIGGQTLRSYIESVVGQMSLPNTQSTTLLSPVANVEELTAQTATIAGTLTAQKTTTTALSAEEIATQELSANQLTTENLTATGNTMLGNLIADTTLVNELTAQTATIAGTLTAQEISGTTGRLAQLEANMAQLEEVRAQVAELSKLNTESLTAQDATISGTLYAASIDRLDEHVAEALRQPSLLELLLNQKTSTSAATLDPVIAQVESAGYTATGAAELNMTLADLQFEQEDIVLEASALFVNQYLKVNGFAYVNDQLGVGDSVLIGNGLRLSDGVIAYEPADASQATLQIQPSGRGTVVFMAGLLVLEEDGLATVNGNVRIAGNLETEGTLLANLLRPTDFGNPFQVQVAGTATESGQVQESRFEIVNETGTPVATISAQGRAEFASLNIGADDLRSATGSAQTDKTSGKATIAAGTTEVIIQSSALTENSLIYVTPLSSTGNQVIYVKSQQPDNPSTPAQEAAFTAGFDLPTPQEVNFNWWIVN